MKISVLPKTKDLLCLPKSLISLCSKLWSDICSSSIKVKFSSPCERRINPVIRAQWAFLPSAEK